MLEEEFGLVDWIEEALETRWIQEIHGACGLRRHNRAHPKRSCEWQLEKDEPRAEDAKDATERLDTRGALPRLRGRLGRARLAASRQ